MDPLARKKQENIAGYVIAMWHVEDLLRAHRFDPHAVEQLFITPMEADERTQEEVRGWYRGIMHRMREQGLDQRGHLAEVEEVVNELEFLHSTLLDVLDDKDYDALWQAAEPGVRTLQEKAGEEAEGPITTCFTAIYGVMLLRTRQQPISAATAEAEAHIRKLLDRLSQHYRSMRRLPGVSMN